MSDPSVVYEGPIGDLLDGPGAFEDGLRAAYETARRIVDRDRAAGVNDPGIIINVLHELASLAKGNHMSWNYRIILHDLDPDPNKHWYGLHEVHYGMPNDPSIPGIGPSAVPASFVADFDEGKDSIIKALERGLKTLHDPRWGVVLTDSGMAQGIGREAASR